MNPLLVEGKCPGDTSFRQIWKRQVLLLFLHQALQMCFQPECFLNSLLVVPQFHVTTTESPKQLQECCTVGFPAVPALILSSSLVYH